MNNNFNFDRFIVEDVTWTLKNFSKKIKEWENLSWEERMEKEKDDPYVLMAYAALITIKSKCGECFAIDDFIELVADGSFIDYDGHGVFVDLFGNKICGLTGNTEWLKNNQPDNAAFIMWYNK